MAEEKVGALCHEVDALRNLIGRTIREQDFIEDCFVALDRAPIEVAPAPAAEPS